MSVAIIAEYNPFHNGHIYQLKEAKKRFPGEEIIIIMSGEYVQRGEIAIASFADRKNIALINGADKVIELPFEYATQAAHIFAEGAINIIHDNNIDKVFFGSESNDPKLLMLIANTIYNDENKYNSLLKKYLKTGGNSFPKSTSLALEELIGHSITLPNDILGLEYCKSIVKNKYQIQPHTLKRTVSFHAKETSGKFSSASHIRELFWSNDEYKKYTPMILDKTRKRIEDYYNKFQKIVIETPANELAKNKMISEGMENLFKKHIDAKSMEEFINRTNSRRYTSSRIKRTILYVLKQIKK